MFQTFTMSNPTTQLHLKSHYVKKDNFTNQTGLRSCPWHHHIPMLSLTGTSKYMCPMWIRVRICPQSNPLIVVREDQLWWSLGWDWFEVLCHISCDTAPMKTLSQWRLYGRNILNIPDVKQQSINQSRCVCNYSFWMCCKWWSSPNSLRPQDHETVLDLCQNLF